jgi:predicted RNA-binding protein associated with RNAse of E/G family
MLIIGITNCKGMTTCIEKKMLLSGELHEYTCKLAHFTETFGVLQYVIGRKYFVNGIALRPGEITTAFYWADRPYTLYVWRFEQPGQELYYFNIADRVSLTRTAFTWRDLVVDILFDANDTAHVLDEEDLPSSISPDLREYIDHAKSHLLAHHSDIIAEVKSWTGAGILRL